MDTPLLMVLVVNIITFLVYGWDKYAAIRNFYRVSEKNLLLLALCFGAPGAFISMKVFHHKTQKPVFMVVVPIIFVIQLVLILMYMNKQGYGY